MSDQLDFTLPDEVTRPPGRGKGRGLNSLLLLLVLVAVVGLGVVAVLRGKAPAPRGGIDPESERVLASKLQDRGLNTSSAEAWLRYLTVAKLDPKEKAARYYDVGKLYQAAGDFEKALVNYFRSEAIARVDELGVELNRRKMECFRRLGNIAGLNRELDAMTSLAPPGTTKEAGADVVAEIGPEKITMEDVSRRIDEVVDLQLKQFSSFMGKEELNKQKERLVDRFRSKEEKFRMLQSMVAEEVLLREAMKRDLDKRAENERAIEEFRRSLLANQVLEAETEQKVNITESDLKDYYGAHREEFREKARVSISQIVTEKEEDAATVLGKLKEGKSFEECAKEFSTDEATKEKGGEVEGPIEKGGPIPGIGVNVDVHAHLFALKENEVSSKPVKVSEKFYIFKVRKLIPERIKPFEEVRADVERRKTQEKVREVREALIQRLHTEHNVIIHRSEFLPEQPEGKERSNDDKKKEEATRPPGTV